ncbi:MAG: insulinase family protein [Bacteroidota bacterium]
MQMKNLFRLFVFSSVLLFYGLLRTQAQDVFKPDQVLTPDPKIIVGRLDNGLTYYIRENKKPEKRAELRFAVKAGSILEDNDQQGLAHFVEHMAFNGTKSFPKQELVNFLEKSGVRFGPEINAYTFFDQTVYMLQVPTDSPAVMKKGFQILEEWADAIAFDDTEIDKERPVIVEEWRLGRGADERVSNKLLPTILYRSHYADRIPIGKKEIIESAPHDVIRRFYNDWYRPDLMAVLAVGDFDKNEIEKLIKEHFSKLTNPRHERVRLAYPIPDHDETLVSIATDPELTYSMVRLFYKHDSHDVLTATDYRNEIIDRLYDGMFNRRLQELLQKPSPPFVFPFGGKSRLCGQKDAYFLGATVKDTAILIGLEALLTEAARVRQYGFTTTELEREKSSSLRGMEQYYRERDKADSRPLVEEYLRNFLNNETIPGIEVELELYKQYLPGITLEEINKLTDERMTSQNCVVTVSAPQKEGLKVPTKEELLALIEATKKEKINPYIDKISSEPLVARMPVPGKVVEEKKIESIGVTEWKLSNGARVVLKPTDFKNDEIVFSAQSDGGLSLVSDQDYASAISAIAIIQVSGLGDFDLSTLQKKLAGKIVNVSPQLGDLYQAFSGSTSVQDIETFFQLLYLYATSVRRDTAAYASLMDRWRAMLQDQGASPERAYGDTLAVTLANYHFRRRPFNLKLMEEVDLDRALVVYKNRFADFSGFTFFFVGSFKPDTLKPYVEKYLASLPSLHRNELWKDEGIRPPKGVIGKKVLKGIEPKSRVNLTFTGPFEWSRQNRYDFNAMKMVLSIKLREVLREDKGGTYGVSIYGSPSHIPVPDYTLILSWGCNPDSVENLIKIVMLQIDSLKLALPDSIYITKVKETERRTYEVNLKENNFWLANLVFYYTNQDNPELILDYPNLVEHLNGQEIRNAVKKYFNMNNYVRVVLYPKEQR